LTKQDCGKVRDEGASVHFLEETNGKRKNNASQRFDIRISENADLFQLDFQCFFDLGHKLQYLSRILLGVDESSKYLQVITLFWGRGYPNSLFLVSMCVQPTRRFRQEENGAPRDNDKDGLKGNWETPDDLAFQSLETGIIHPIGEENPKLSFNEIALGLYRHA
jgi:hypothetical protein